MQNPELGPNWYEVAEKAVEYVSLIDGDNKLLYVNHMNDSLDMIVGLPVFDFVDQQFHQVLIDSMDVARQFGVPQQYNSYAVNTEGERSFFSNWVIALQIETMESVVAVIATDVTHLTRVEEELELSESTLRSLLENSPDTIFVLDRNRKLLFASKLEYGFESEQVLGLSADLFVAEQDLPAALAAFEQVLQTGSMASYETMIVTPEGPRRFSARLAPINNRGEIDRVMLVATDVTERYEAEMAQARLQEQLQQAQKMEAIGQLTGGIAHDFNNILLTISGNLELAQLQLDEPKLTLGFIQEALGGVQRASDLTQRLLAFSRKQPLNPETVDVSTLVESMLTILRRTLGENIQVRMECGNASGKMIRVDRTQLENAILNLALNARDAMPDGGELLITLAWSPDEVLSEVRSSFGIVQISISDNGIGMDENTVTQAIDPFFTTKEVGEGTGLGLSMVFGFVKQSNGVLRLASKPGQGTTVEIDLPSVGVSTLQAGDADDNIETPKGRGELILLVEDDATVRQLTARILEELGYTTLTVASGDAALEVLTAQDDIEMVMTDVVMPGMVNGFELARRCREIRPELPLMLVSGHPLDARVSGTHEEWLHLLLQKPYRTDELARFIANILAGTDYSVGEDSSPSPHIE